MTRQLLETESKSAVSIGEAILAKKTKEMENVVGIQKVVDNQETKLGELYKK